MAGSRCDRKLRRGCGTVQLSAKISPPRNRYAELSSRQLPNRSLLEKCRMARTRHFCRRTLGQTLRNNPAKIVSVGRISLRHRPNNHRPNNHRPNNPRHPPNNHPPNNHPPISLAPSADNSTPTTQINRIIPNKSKQIKVRILLGCWRISSVNFFRYCGLNASRSRVGLVYVWLKTSLISSWLLLLVHGVAYRRRGNLSADGAGLSALRIVVYLIKYIKAGFLHDRIQSRTHYTFL